MRGVRDVRMQTGWIFFLEMTDKMPFFLFPVFSWHNPPSGLIVKKWDFLQAKMPHKRL